MARSFVLEDRIHSGDDPHCPSCPESYPRRGTCGGLIHGAADPEDEETEVVSTTQCDTCDRSEEEALGEEVA